jgi:hypothetical protein
VRSRRHRKMSFEFPIHPPVAAMAALGLEVQLQAVRRVGITVAVTVVLSLLVLVLLSTVMIQGFGIGSMCLMHNGSRATVCPVCRSARTGTPPAPSVPPPG